MRKPAIELEKDHDRIEKKEYLLCTDPNRLDQKNEWADPNAVGMVRSTRISNDGMTTKNRHAIPSLTDVEKTAKSTRVYLFLIWFQ